VKTPNANGNKTLMRFGVKAGLTNDTKPDEDEQKMLPKDPSLCRAIPESRRHKRAEDVSVCVEGGYWIRDFIPSQSSNCGKTKRMVDWKWRKLEPTNRVLRMFS
jgi:hypothetical protein